MSDSATYTDHQPVLLSVSQVCKRLDMSLSFIYQEVSAGRLEHYQLGRRRGRIRVSERQLSEYLESYRKSSGRVKAPVFDLVLPPAKHDISRDLTSLLS